MILLCVYLSCTQGGYSIASLREKRKKLFPFHGLIVLHRSALALTTRCLCTKNGLTHFTSKCCALFLGPSTKTKNWFRHFTPVVFYTFRGGSVHAVLVHQLPYFTTDVLCRTVSPVQKWSYATARLNLYPCAFSFAELSISYTGRLLLVALTRHFAIGSLRWGFRTESNLHNE